MTATFEGSQRLTWPNNRISAANMQPCSHDQTGLLSLPVFEPPPSCSPSLTILAFCGPVPDEQILSMSLPCRQPDSHWTSFAVLQQSRDCSQEVLLLHKRSIRCSASLAVPASQYPSCFACPSRPTHSTSDTEFRLCNGCTRFITWSEL